MKADKAFIDGNTIALPFSTSAGGMWVVVLREDEAGSVEYGLQQLTNASEILVDEITEDERPLSQKPPASRLRVVPNKPEESA